MQRLRDNPSYKRLVSQQDIKIATHDPGNQAALMAFDFFRTESGLRLVEINTNGGGFLVAMMRAHMGLSRRLQTHTDLVTTIRDMFLNEYTLSTGKTNLKTVAIVDENPNSQNLFFEFLGFQRLFRSFGWTTEILAPQDLIFDRKTKRLKTKKGQPIDLVYNRHCDFYLRTEPVDALKQAYLENAICLTPNPHEYGLLADKSRLVDLSDPKLTKSLNLTPADTKLIRSFIPTVRNLNDIPLEDVHQNKSNYFFKPKQSFGSKGVYSGKKITHRKIDEIATQDYILQPIFTPKKINVPGVATPFKEELRAFAYNGQIQLITGRLYQGQVFNMKTPGSGFSSVTIA